MPTSFIPPDPIDLEYDEPFLRLEVELPQLRVETQTVEVLTFEFTIPDPFGISLDFDRRFAAVRLPDTPDVPDVGDIIDTIQNDYIDPAISEVRGFVSDVRRDLQRDLRDVEDRVDAVAGDINRGIGSVIDGLERRVSDIREEIDQTVADVQSSVRATRRRVDRLVSETVADLRSGLASARESIDAAVADVTSRLDAEVAALDQAIDDRVQALREEILGQLPAALLEDPAKWSFSTAIGYFESQLGDGILPSLKATVDGVLDAALGSETKERLRDRREDT